MAMTFKQNHATKVNIIIFRKLYIDAMINTHTWVTMLSITVIIIVIT